MTEILASIKRIISENDRADALSDVSAKHSADIELAPAEVVELYGNREETDSQIQEPENNPVLENGTYDDDDTLELTALVEDDGTIVTLEPTPPPGDIVVNMDEASPPIDVIDVPKSLLRKDASENMSDASLDGDPQTGAAQEVMGEPVEAVFETDERANLHSAEELIPVEEKAAIGNSANEDPNGDYWVGEEKRDHPSVEADSMAAVDETVSEAPGRKGILSSDAAAATGAAFAQLAESSKPAGQSVDDLVRDLLRPLLQEWLDENLPSLVEKMIDREIARISGREDVP